MSDVKALINQQKRIKSMLKNGKYTAVVRNQWNASQSPILISFYRGKKLIRTFFGHNEAILIAEAHAWLKTEGLRP